MIFYNSENSMPDIRSFCRPLFCHSSVVKYKSSLLQKRSRYETDYQILLKSPPPKVTGWIRPCYKVLSCETIFVFRKQLPLVTTWYPLKQGCPNLFQAGQMWSGLACQHYLPTFLAQTQVLIRVWRRNILLRRSSSPCSLSAHKNITGNVITRNHRRFDAET